MEEFLPSRSVQSTQGNKIWTTWIFVGEKAKMSDNKENTVRPQRLVGAGEGCILGSESWRWGWRKEQDWERERDEAMDNISQGRSSVQQLFTECTSGADTNINQNFGPEEILKYHLGVSHVTLSTSWKCCAVGDGVLCSKVVIHQRWKPDLRTAHQHRDEWASGLCPPLAPPALSTLFKSIAYIKFTSIWVT